MKNNLLILLFIVSTAMLLFSCADDSLYDQSYDFKGGVWNNQDTAAFYVDVENINVNYNFFLTLRTTKKYKYSNLWVKVIIESPDHSKSIMAQRIDIANPDGSWRGKVSGSIIENRLHYKTNAFPIEGQYVFKLVHAVEQPNIEEVLDIGMRIEEI